MNIKVSFSRKVGQQNYGSAGASCEVSWNEPGDPEEVSSPAFAEELGRQIRKCYEVCETSVADQLARWSGGPGEPPAEPPRQLPPLTRPQEDPKPQPKRFPVAKLPNGARLTWQPDPRTGEPTRFSKAGLLPTNGRELVAWAKRQEEEGDTGLVKRIKAWGQDSGLGWKLADWPADAVAAAVQAELHADSLS